MFGFYFSRLAVILVVDLDFFLNQKSKQRTRQADFTLVPVVRTFSIGVVVVAEKGVTAELHGRWRWSEDDALGTCCVLSDVARATRRCTSACQP